MFKLRSTNKDDAFAILVIFSSVFPKSGAFAALNMQ